MAEDGGGSLDRLYQRIATDIAAGGRLQVLVHIALCDNDTQGIVPVKNRSICNGDAPEQNIYWGTRGGLAGFAKADGYRRIEYTLLPTGPLAIRARWHKRFQPGPELRRRGVHGSFEVELIGLAYRGAHIGTAMHDFVRSVHRDLPEATGEVPHLVGYIGHNYFLDVADPRALYAERSGDSVLEKGAFALSCLGDQYIRPAIARDNARILALNRHLTYPGAWTLGGIIEGLARGNDLEGVVSQAAARFAEAMQKSKGAILRSLAYGP